MTRTNYRWFVVFLLFAITVVNYIDRAAIAYAIPIIQKDLGLSPAVTGNPHITTIVTREGGHCAFVEQTDGGYDGYWAEREVVRFATAVWRESPSGPSRTPDLSLPLRA